MKVSQFDHLVVSDIHVLSMDLSVYNLQKHTDPK